MFDEFFLRKCLFSEGSKDFFHVRNLFRCELGIRLGPVDVIAPVLAFVLVLVVIKIVFGAKIKGTLILECLLLAADFTAKIVAVVLCKEGLPAHFAGLETESPFVEAMEIISDERMERVVGRDALKRPAVIRIPQFKAGVFAVGTGNEGT